MKRLADLLYFWRQSGLMKLFRIIFSVYALLLFVMLMLVVFPFALFSVFLGRIKGGNFIYRACVIWADIWFALVFIPVKKINRQFYEAGKKYIIVPNHISYLDIPVMVKAFREPVRPLGKVEMTKVPIFGFIYRRAIVTVDRENATNRVKSVKILKSIISKGISVLVFPEGTFNETGKALKPFYNGAFRTAIETQTPIKPVLFLDTFNRMPYTYLLSLNPGKCRIVYLPDISVDGLSLDDVEKLKEQTFTVMEKELIKYRASWIKSDG